MEKINKDLVAACGMNCGVCRAHLRKDNPCNGCKDIKPDSPKTRVSCFIRTCKERKGEFCFNCAKFPCDKLKHLDKRYREKYGVSEIKNLEFIRDRGLDEFIKSEITKWESDKGILCVHNRKYY